MKLSKNSKMLITLDFGHCEALNVNSWTCAFFDIFFDPKQKNAFKSSKNVQKIRNLKSIPKCKKNEIAKKP